MFSVPQFYWLSPETGLARLEVCCNAETAVLHHSSFPYHSSTNNPERQNLQDLRSAAMLHRYCTIIAFRAAVLLHVQCSTDSPKDRTYNHDLSAIMSAVLRLSDRSRWPVHNMWPLSLSQEKHCRQQVHGKNRRCLLTFPDVALQATTGTVRLQASALEVHGQINTGYLFHSSSGNLARLVTERSNPISSLTN